jgi:CRISPR system Cascade subunit CasE
MEVYLTKIILNPRSKRVRAEIANPHELHRTISRAFPETSNGETPRQKFDILYRLDINRQQGRAVLLVQGTAKPDWSFLPSDYAAEEIQCKPVGSGYAAIENGMRLVFRLHANPAKRAGKNSAADSDEFRSKFIEAKQRRRLPIRGDEERINWLRRKGADSGFSLGTVRLAPLVPDVTTAEQGTIVARKYTDQAADSKMKLTLSSVVFEGTLEVTDAAAFKEAIVKGIGSGKAYGFGLLSVARGG